MDDLDVAGENSPSPSTSTTPQNGHSGITLVLPSLRALQAANAGKKSESKQASVELDQRPKNARPVKLKPLKEVLTKLITQIKKKDDYAFFIHPVDPALVPGYTDAIKNPMDFGTMTARVAKGKYRSLEEFTNDFRLVTTNAKTFNPPGSIYYSEADRLEAWGLDHIARASAHVIEYETDWNIDIERNEDGSTSQQPVNVDDEVSTPQDLDGSMAAGSRAPSMTPAPGQPPTLGQGKRGPRGPYKKHAPTPLSEGLDADGGMPGVKDGVGVFPAGSDWAELMIALKIKGKRYRTKKERLRFEKEGPPYHADGSLDYTEMEDPFSVLNVFVPEPPVRPRVTPLYLSTSDIPSTIITAEGTLPLPQMSQPRIHPPVPVTIPSDRPLPVLSTLSHVSTEPSVVASTSAPSIRSPKKRRHWTVVRNLPTRSRGKDKDGEATADDTKTSWKVPGDAGPADYGTFATFLGELAASSASSTSNAADYIYSSDSRLFATIRSTVEHRGAKRKRETKAEEPPTAKSDEGGESIWTDERAEEAWDYLRDVVYGGVDGYAYVRSLAEFVAPSVYLDACDLEGGDDEDEPDVDEKLSSTSEEERGAVFSLGVPLARYVEDNLVDMVSRGRHGWLRDVFVPAAAIAGDPACALLCGDAPTPPFHLRLAALPGAARAVAAFQEWCKEPLDMATLIRVPGELATETALEGGPGEGGEHGAIDRALSWGVEMFAELDKQAQNHGHEKDGCGGGSVRVKEETTEDAHVGEGVDEGAGNAMDVDMRSDAEIDDTDPMHSRSPVKSETDVDGAEDPLLKRLRLNLLALAKRAPLDRIAKLPAELVPEHIREIVPTA